MEPLHPTLRRYADPPTLRIARYVAAGAACGFAGIALALALLRLADTDRANDHQAHIEASRQAFASQAKDKVLAHVLARDFNLLGYAPWVAAHPTDDCPSSLAELEPYVGEGTSVDPWGTGFRFHCTRSGLVVASAGPDREFDTADDIGGAE